MAFIAVPSFHPFPLGMAVFALLQWGKTTQGGSSMRTFLEYYRRSIQPQIEMIDIFLKTEQPPYDKTAVAKVLGLSAEALTARMQKEHLAYITKGIFFRLLAEGENSLGGMLKRAVACGLPERYTPETAAYVFGLPLAAVREAAEKTDCSSFSEETLPVLFSEIMLCEIPDLP